MDTEIISGEDFHFQLGDREQSAAQNDRHEQISGDDVVGEPGDCAIHPVLPSSD
jgi:hypothetical protein